MAETLAGLFAGLSLGLAVLSLVLWRMLRRTGIVPAAPRPRSALPVTSGAGAPAPDAGYTPAERGRLRTQLITRLQSERPDLSTEARTAAADEILAKGLATLARL